MAQMSWGNYIPQDKKLLWIAVFAYFPVCYGLAGILNLIEIMVLRLFVRETPNFLLMDIVHNLLIPALFYAVILSLSFAFIRYFFKMDDKLYSYFSRINILIIFVISILLDAFSKTITPLPARFAYPVSDTNMLLYCIITTTGDVIGLALLAVALIFIWKLTFKMPQSVFALFISAYCNIRGVIALTAAWILIAVSTFLSYISWQRYDFLYSANSLIGFVEMLTGGGQIFPQFGSFKFYATLLLFVIPIFYRCKPQNG